MEKVKFMLVFSALFLGLFFLYGCSDEEICPDNPGYVLCGYCSEDAALSDNPNAGQCRYCPEGTYCSGDECGDIACIPYGSNGGTSGGSQQCPAEQGYTLCGYCSNIDQCKYCPQGTYCPSDFCYSDICPYSSGGTSGGGGSKYYYASCSQCKYGYSGYSYEGYDYATCNYYYQLCVAAECGKILDNCR